MGTVPVSNEDIHESEPDELIFESDDSTADIDDNDTIFECSESSDTSTNNTMTSDIIELLQMVTTVSDQAIEGRNINSISGILLLSPFLHDPPTDVIEDKVSAVLGDIFHAIDRPKIPIHHEYKKVCKHALQEAFFAWNPTKMEMVESALKAEGLTEQSIEAMLYYNNKFFTSKVDQNVPEPSKLYWRVRSVFVVFWQ
jgi:hypothetical protein